MSDFVRIIEVAPRDGLQNESTPISLELKRQFIAQLVSAKVSEIEATSFVSPKWVPQLADADDLLQGLPSGPLYSALVPNRRGLDRALQSGIKRISVFTAASEEFTKKNINMTIAESLEEFKAVIQGFREAGGDFVRGYLSTVVECPYAGRISPTQVVEVAERLMDLGVDEISFGETIGVAAPNEIYRLMEAVDKRIPMEYTVWHFHDTNGTGVANVAAALDFGYRAFDSSAAGLGGCPYAKGAGGNVATEDVVYLAHRMGFETGIHLESLSRASLPVLEALGRAPTSRAQVASLAAMRVPAESVR